MKFLIENIFRYTYKPRRTLGKKAHKVHEYIGIPFIVRIHHKTGEPYIDTIVLKRDGDIIKEWPLFLKELKKNTNSININIQNEVKNSKIKKFPPNILKTIEGVRSAAGIKEPEEEAYEPLYFKFETDGKTLRELNQIIGILKAVSGQKSVTLKKILQTLNINKPSWKDRKKIVPGRTFRHRGIEGSSEIT